MVTRGLAFVVWALVAGSGVFWAFKLLAQPLPVPPQATLAGPVAPGLGADLGPLFGAAPPTEVAAAAPAAEQSRFQLIGVVAARPPGSTSQGVALIAVDGKPPRAYRVGSVVADDLVLQAVQGRSVNIGPRGGVARVALELPPLPPPATGVPAGMGTGAVAPLSAPAQPRPSFGAAPALPVGTPMGTPVGPGVPLPAGGSLPQTDSGVQALPVTNPDTPPPVEGLSQNGRNQQR